MKKRSRRYKQIKEVFLDQKYSVNKAIEILKKNTSSNFNESLEAHASLNIDPKYADQQLRSTLILPEGTGQSKRIAVIVDNDEREQATNAGADVIGSEDLIETISKGSIEFEILITTPKMMPKLAKLGKVLGPKGLMPSPKTGTITMNLKETIEEFKKGKIEYRADKNGNVHIMFGKVQFSIESLLTNLKSVFNSIEKNRPPGVKGRYIKSFSICTTMSPSVLLDLETLR